MTLPPITNQDIATDPAKYGAWLFSGARHRNYESEVEYARTLAPHAFGDYPEDVIDRKRPNENPDIKEYRKESWEPITTDEFDRAATVLKRIFTPGFFSIVYPPVPPSIPDDKIPSVYFETEFGKWKSVTGFLQDCYLLEMLGDPNGVIIMLPSRNLEDDWINPLPHIVHSKRVFDFVDGQRCTVLTNERSPVTVGTMTKNEGEVYLVVTPEFVWKLVQTGKKSDGQFVTVPLFEGPGILPAKRLGGIWKSRDGVSFYRSFFGAAVPSWNKAIQSETELDGAYITAVIPQRILLDIPCSVCEGSGRYKSLDGGYNDCATCKGTGSLWSMNKGGPYEDMVIDPTRLENVKPSEAIHYAPIPTEAIELQEKRQAKYFNKAAKAIHIDILDKLGSNQSGIAKDRDRDGLFTMLMDVSKRVYDTGDWIYKVGCRWRYAPWLVSTGMKPETATKAAEELAPAITKPRKFQITPMGELIVERGTASKNGAPRRVIAQYDREIAFQKLGPGTLEARMAEAEIALDPYSSMSEDTYLAKRQAGMIIPELDFIHTNIQFLIDEAITRNPGFFDLDRAGQMAILKGLAAEFRPEPTPPPTLPGLGGN